MKIILNHILFLLVCCAAVSQPTMKQFIKSGEKAFQDKNYSGALDFFQQAYEKDTLNDYVINYLAESARLQFAYSKAEWAYEKIIGHENSSSYPKATYYLGEIKNILGKYDEAAANFNLYLSENEGDDPALTTRAQQAIESANWALEELKTAPEELDITQLPAGINTPYSEHAPFEVENELYFASLQFPLANDSYESGRLVSKIMKSSDLMVSEPLETSGNLNDDRKLSSSAAISEDGKFFFYTICGYVRGNDIECEIYVRTRDEDGSWGGETKLPDKINQEGYTATHPAIRVQDDGSHLLYFVSNAPNGKGGLDIWQSTFDSELNFSDPVNFESVNTEWNEITPFYDSQESILYFSSDGRPGMGGFDIYMSSLDHGESDINNLGHEVNSSFNEIFYFKNNERAYFSSNRTGSQYILEKYETCCFDIYRVDYPYCELELLTFDALTREQLPGVTAIFKYSLNGWSRTDTISEPDTNRISLKIKCNTEYEISLEKLGYKTKDLELPPLDSDRMDSVFLEREDVDLVVHTFEKNTKLPLDGVNLKVFHLDTLVEEQQHEERHGINFSVIPGLDYKIIASKEGYETEVVEIHVPFDPGKSTTTDIFLNKTDLQLVVFTYEKATQVPLDGVTVRLENLTDLTVNEQLFENWDTSRFDMAISNHKRYRITASKEGYDDEVIEFDAEYTGSDVIRKDIYLGRIAVIETLEGLIPLKLYFDNDEPDRHVFSQTTKKNYSVTYFFYNNNIGKYKSSYVSLFKGSERNEARMRAEGFYDGELKEGYENFIIFLETLHRILMSGKKVNLYLRGYASPLYTEEYNFSIGKRRIESIKNEFYLYEEGVLNQYLNSGQLVLTERSFGELESSPNVSDDPTNPGLSIYSPEAARERRIEIEEIKEIKN